MSISNAVRYALAPVLFVAMAGQAWAQSVTIEFVNAPGMEPIQLLQGTNVGINGDGNLTASCVLDGTVCDGINVDVSGPVPVTTLERTSAAGNINTGGTLSLKWTVIPAADYCIATSSPVIAGWNNTLIAATGGNANLTMSAAGDYTLSLKCYNAHGVSNQSTVTAAVRGQDIGTIQACTDEALNETGRVQPDDFTGHLFQWSGLFWGASFPNGPSHLAPIGSFSLRTTFPPRGPSMAKRYLTVPFRPAANMNYRISWLEAQAVPVTPYGSPKEANTIFVSVSKCAGDLRGHSAAGGMDLNLCRAQTYSGNLFFGTKTTSQCKLVAGEDYYLNIAFVDTSGTGALPSVTSCKSGDICEGNFSMKALP